MTHVYLLSFQDYESSYIAGVYVSRESAKKAAVIFAKRKNPMEWSAALLIGCEESGDWQIEERTVQP